MTLRNFDLDIYHLRTSQMVEIFPVLNFDPLCILEEDFNHSVCGCKYLHFVLISILLFSILDTSSKHAASQVILTIQDFCASRSLAFHQKFSVMGLISLQPNQVC